MRAPKIYMALGIPVEPCEPPAGLCSHEPEVELSPGYLDRASIIAGHQLAKAGFRLASLLNEIWPQPISADEKKRDARYGFCRRSFRFVKTDRHDRRESKKPYLRVAWVWKLRHYGTPQSCGVSERAGCRTGRVTGLLIIVPDECGDEMEGFC